MVGKSIWVIAVVLCLVCMSATPSAHAQAVYGSITGSVTDPQGSGVPGAKVVVTNVTKGTTEEATTNESGNYTVTHLIPDAYKIRIEAPGFKAYEIPSVRVGADTAVRADAQLQVGAVTITLAEISTIQPFERSFWSRFETAVDFGYSMTQANHAKQLTLGANLLYRDANKLDTVLANVFKSSQSNAPETQRWDLGNDFRYLLGDRWYANTSQDFLNSDEQGLDLRTTIGGGGGRYLLRSSSQYLAVGGGLAWTREDYTDPLIETKDSGEAYIGTEFMTEKLKIADLVTRFNYYPSLTIDNRYRINYTFDLDFNLPGDWYIRVSLFENYDSKPPGGLSNNDYGWSNAFGFKF